MDSVTATTTTTAEKKSRRARSKPAQWVGEDQFRCQTITDFWQSLKMQVENAEASFVPELRRSTFILPASMVLQLSNITDQELSDLTLDGSLITIGAALDTTVDMVIINKRQDAIAWTLVRAAGGIDGYKYFKKQSWPTKEDNGSNYRFICIDSFQNKDRVRNKSRKTDVGAGIADADEPDQSGGLPTYDCNGSISIKFSGISKSVVLHYQHLPIHRDTTASNGAIAGKDANGVTNVKEKPLVARTKKNIKSQQADLESKKRKRQSKISKPDAVDLTNDHDWDAFNAQDDYLVGEQLINEAMTFRFPTDPFGLPQQLTQGASAPKQKKQSGVSKKRVNITPERPKIQTKVPLPQVQAAHACQPCRTRRKKCDMVIPACSSCTNARNYGAESCLYDKG